MSGGNGTQTSISYFLLKRKAKIRKKKQRYYKKPSLHAYKSYLVILRRSKKLGDPCRLGIDGERDLELLLELREELELDTERLLDCEFDLEDPLELDEWELLRLLACPELQRNN